MSITATFKSGNFNQFEKFARKELPSKIDLIRYNIIPKIDDVLRSMLGQGLQVEKTSIDIDQICDKENLIGLLCKIVYNVSDFNVPDAPRVAIDQDTETFIKYLSREDAHLKKVEIDVRSGSLTILYEIPLARS
jgi:hypothetical protein